MFCRLVVCRRVVAKMSSSADASNGHGRPRAWMSDFCRMGWALEWWTYCTRRYSAQRSPCAGAVLLRGRGCTTTFCLGHIRGHPGRTPLETYGTFDCEVSSTPPSCTDENDKLLQLLVDVSNQTSTQVLVCDTGKIAVNSLTGLGKLGVKTT